MQVKRLSFLFLVAVVISIFLQKDLVINRLSETQEKIAIPVQSSRTDVGDTYHYYILGKQFFNSVINQDENSSQIKDGSEVISPIAKVYMGSLFLSGMITWVAELVTFTSRDAVLLSLILQGAFIIFAFTYTLFTFVRVKDNANFFGVAPIVSFASAYLVNWFLVASYYGRGWFSVKANVPYPELFRIVNPQMGWVYGLFFLCLLKQYLDGQSKKLFYLSLLIAGCMGLFSISLTAAFLSGIAVLGLLLFFREHKIYADLLLIIFMLSASFLGVNFLFSLFWDSAIGDELMTGKFVGISFKPHFLFFLLLIIPINKLFHDKSKFLLMALLTSSCLMGALCDSVELGSRLWIRGSSLIVWGIIWMVILEFGRTLFYYYKHSIYQRSYRYFLVGCRTLSLSIIMTLVVSLFYVKHNNQWRGYVEKDKWELLDWLNHELPQGAVVLSSNIEDSYFIPIYTKGRPFIPLYGTTGNNSETLLKKYAYMLDKYGKKPMYLQSIEKCSQNDVLEFLKIIYEGKRTQIYPYEDYQTRAFFHSLIYYPYNKRYNKIFENHDEKKRLVRLLQLSTQQFHHPQYILIDKQNDSMVKIEGRKLYENRRFIVLKGGSDSLFN